MTRVLVTRPEPGAGETAARLAARGHAPLVLPLFETAVTGWAPPDDVPDAVMLTSAAATRHGGPGLAAYFGLPCFCVGERTAAAAREAGFTDVRAPQVRDGGALLSAIAATGHRGILHLAGADVAAYPPPEGLRVTRRVVYAAHPRAWSAAERDAALAATCALAFSPRGAARLAEALGADRAAFHLAAISPNAAEAAGEGWASVAVAATPDEDALFAAAGLLCDKPDGDASLTRTP